MERERGSCRPSRRVLFGRNLSRRLSRGLSPGDRKAERRVSRGDQSRANRPERRGGRALVGKIRGNPPLAPPRVSTNSLPITTHASITPQTFIREDKNCLHARTGDPVSRDAHCNG